MLGWTYSAVSNIINCRNAVAIVKIVFVIAVFFVVVVILLSLLRGQISFVTWVLRRFAIIRVS